MRRLSSGRCGAPILILTLAAAGACSTGSPPSEGMPSAGRPGPSGDSIETILAHADGAFRDGAYDEAAAAYEQALRIDPDRAHAVAALATCYLKDRLTKKADDLLTAYLER